MEKRTRSARENGIKKQKKSEDFSYLHIEPPPCPEVYVTKPHQPTEKKKGQLTEKQLDQFFDKGFVVVDDFFEPNRLDEVRKAVDALVDKTANKLFKGGKIKNKHEDKGFLDRLLHLEKEFKGATIVMIKLGLLPEELQNLWSDERLLNVAEQIVGPEIAGHPVWNLRCKTPHNEQTTVPWHQDNAYLQPRSVEVMMLTAWIPLINANSVNGCLQVASGGHRKGKTARHTCCAGGTWYVEVDEQTMAADLEVDLERDRVTCEVPYGGVLFMNNAIPHRSLENRSENVRWSLDLRWQRADKPNYFYGLKDSVLLRTAKDKDYQINWDKMANINRNKLEMDKVDEDTTDEFNTEISGPWMKRWEIVHHNRHTDALK